MKKSPKSLQVPGIIHIFASGYSCEVFTPSSVGHRSAILLGLFYALYHIGGCHSVIR